MAGNRHLGYASINMEECVALRDGILVATYNGISNLQIKGASKVIIICYKC